jgi:ATP-dependent helicase/nuclease subunit A
MKVLVDLLSVIDNPRCDVPLCRLITARNESIAPLFTFEETVKIRKHTPESKSLYDAIIGYVGDNVDNDIAQKCREFTAEADKMRLISSRLPADKLLRALSGSERYSRLTETEAYTYLYDCACRYARNSWNGLYNFLVYLKNLMEKGGSGAESQKSEDSVTIMTIHQSKGLEFPVCFLFGLNKGFNLADSKSPVIFSKDFGISLKLPPHNDGADIFESIRTRYSDTLLWKSADLLLKQKQIEEEARIFYVALTRARERLYLSATLRKSFMVTVTDAEACADPLFEIKKGKSYMSQTLFALAKSVLDITDPIHDCLDIKLHDKNSEFLDSRFNEDEDDEDKKVIDNSELDLAIAMRSHISESDEEKLLSTIPAKVAASKVSSTMLDDSIFIPLPTGMLFSDGSNEISDADKDSALTIKNRIALMRSQKTDFDSLLLVNKKPTAAEKGTATHLFLQYCDFENVEKNCLDAEIDRLREKRFITERTSKIIDRRQLAGFFKSDLYEHIKDAQAIRREFRFGMFKSASEFTENEKLKGLVADKKIFVQGSIDLIIENKNGELMICDYKTDRVSAEEKLDPALLAENMRKKHADQLREYTYAVTNIFGRAPDKIFIYSVPSGITVEI